jgi:small nuclear ribonucleoprotein (snRNP)-like protein
MIGKIKESKAKTFKEVLEKATIKSEVYDFVKDMLTGSIRTIQITMKNYKDVVGELTLRDEWALIVLTNELERRDAGSKLIPKEVA